MKDAKNAVPGGLKDKPASSRNNAGQAGRINRRAFLDNSLTAAVVAPMAARSVALQPSGSSLIAEVEHLKLHGDRDSFCGHPRSGGLFNLGRGEIVVLHYHAPCAYQKRLDVQHDFGGYHSRAVMLLQRSLDGGRTWPGEYDVEVWNEAAPVEERAKILLSALTSPRESIDFSRPESISYVGHTFLGPPRYGTHQLVGFMLRSADKGRTWEKVPTLFVPPAGGYGSCPDNGSTLVRMPDGTLLIPNRTREGQDSIDLYASTDNGLSWQWRTQIMPGRSIEGEPTSRYYYPTLVLLKSGQLQCYAYPLSMCYSDDGGKTWSKRKLIIPPGPSPWASDDPVYDDPVHVDDNPQKSVLPMARRSPLPLLLRDGRIVILFARRLSPRMGMGVIVSTDEGKTWSPDVILRDDANSARKRIIRGREHDYADIGYPLATQLEDGRIFTAYYYHVNDGNGFGGSRFIAGTFFQVK